MIEVPPDFLNVVFTLLIVAATITRSEQRADDGRAFES